MGQEPSDIRAELEETRARVGEEVDALSYKTDVGARVSDYVGEKKDAVASKVTAVVPDRRRIRQVRTAAEQNPLGLAIGGAAVGFVVGLLLPSTRVEDEKLGQASEKLSETAGEAWQHGKQVAQDAAQSAVETAKESGREHGEELSSTLQSRAQGEHPVQPESEHHRSTT